MINKNFKISLCRFLWIFNAQGKVLGKIKLPGAVSNCALADAGKTLFVTNDDRVVRIKLKK